jgi:hypothetical protein
MTTARRARTKVGKPFIAPARYARVVRGVRKFAATRVKLLENEMAAIERSARSGAATYLHVVVKELRRFEEDLRRLEKKVAPASRRTRKTPAKKPAVIGTVPSGIAAA